MASLFEVFLFDFLYVLVDLISLIGSILVFYGCCRAKSFDVPLKLILTLTIFNFTLSLADLVGASFVNGELECKIFHFIRQLSANSSLVWLTSMAIISALTLRDSQRDLSKAFNAVLGISMIVAVLLASRPFLGLSAYTFEFFEDEDEEESIFYCGIHFNNEGTNLSTALLIIFSEQAPVYFVGLILTLVTYFKARSSRRESLLGEEFSKSEQTESIKLLQYPISQLIVYFPSMIYTVILIMSSPEDSQLLPFLKTLYSLCGFIAFLQYKKQMKENQEPLLENYAPPDESIDL